jgi:hypothetical protein
MDALELFKSIGSAAAGASVLGYVAGYLSVRARAYALGTDAGFKLVDEAYIFAGFRLLFVTLIVVLLASPLLLLARAGAAWFEARLGSELLSALRWPTLSALAILTLLELGVLLSPGALLSEGASTAPGPFAQRILGERSPVPFIVLSTLLPLLCAFWLHSRIETGFARPFEIGLGLVTALQLLLLPIYHGALLADRKVRVLAQKPRALQQLCKPIGIVDRTSEHVALLASDARGVRLVTVLPVDDLNGIAVERIVTIRKFLGELQERTPA